MYDKELILEVLEQIQTASQTILDRFKPVKTVSDFTGMLLVVIGETLKKLDKITTGSLLPNYPQIDWKKAKGLRDIISHQYFDVNTEAIFDVCKTKIQPLANTITKIIKDLK